MHPLDALRQMAQVDPARDINPIRTEPPSPLYACPYCGLLGVEPTHQPACPWLALPEAIALLEAAPQRA